MGDAIGQRWQAIRLRPKLHRADCNATIRPTAINRMSAAVAGIEVHGALAVGASSGFTSLNGTLHGAEYPTFKNSRSRRWGPTTLWIRKALTFLIR